MCFVDLLHAFVEYANAVVASAARNVNFATAIYRFFSCINSEMHLFFVDIATEKLVSSSAFVYLLNCFINYYCVLCNLLPLLILIFIIFYLPKHMQDE